MSHAGSASPSTLSPLLTALNGLPEIEERQQGIYHHRGVALLHFHEDGAGRYADLRMRDFRWQCHPVNTPGEQARLLLRLWLALPDALPAGMHASGRPRVARDGVKRKTRANSRAPAAPVAAGAPCRSPRCKP